MESAFFSAGKILDLIGRADLSFFASNVVWKIKDPFLGRLYGLSFVAFAFFRIVAVLLL